jgi:hypothetical protein
MPPAAVPADPVGADGRYAFHAAGDLALFPLVTDWARAEPL